MEKRPARHACSVIFCSQRKGSERQNGEGFDRECSRRVAAGSGWLMAVLWCEGASAHCSRVPPGRVSVADPITRLNRRLFRARTGVY